MSATPENRIAIAFEGTRRFAEGSLLDVALAVKRGVERTGGRGPDALLVFNAMTGRVIDLNLSGGEADVQRRYAPAEPEAVRGPGRPRLGVTAKEVTLLPRHWEWLAAQPGGASVTLRKLIDAARRDDDERGNARAAQEAAYQFMRVLAGNLPLYEEATRALFASDAGRFAELTQGWPTDVRNHARRMASAAFDASARTL